MIDTMKKKQTQLLEKTATLLDKLAEKCGGPGGKPGPCPSGAAGKPSVGMSNSGGIKPTKPPKSPTKPEVGKEEMKKLVSKAGGDVLDAVPKGTKFKLLKGVPGELQRFPPKVHSFSRKRISPKDPQGEEKGMKALAEGEALIKTLQKKDPAWKEMKYSNSISASHPDGHRVSHAFYRNAAGRVNFIERTYTLRVSGKTEKQ